MATPEQRRPPTTSQRERERAPSREPVRKRTAPVRSAARRPNASAMRPADADPARPPTVAAEAIRPCRPGRLSSPYCGTIESSAPAMMAVS
jgi:hypothetical protein